MDRKSLRKIIQQEIVKVKEDYLVPREEVPPDFARVVPADDQEDDPESDCGEIPVFEPAPMKKLSCSSCGGVLVMEGGCGCPAPSHDMMQSIMHSELSKPHKEGAYMAKSQLHKIEKYAGELQAMIPEGHNLEDWMRTKISQSADDLGEVYHKLEYKSHSE